MTYEFMGGIITSGIIVTSVTTALFQYIATDMREEWAESHKSLGPLRKIIGDIEANGSVDGANVLATAKIIEKVGLLSGQTCDISYTMRGFLFFLMFVFAGHQLAYLLGMRYYCEMLPWISGTLIVSYISLVGGLIYAWVRQTKSRRNLDSYVSDCSDEIKRSEQILAIRITTSTP